MKTKYLILIFTLIAIQFTFSQVQLSCNNVNSIIGSSSSILFLNTNDCEGDIVISIDENLLSNNEGITIEGELSKNRKSIRIVGHQNHTISLVPFDKENTLQKKVISYKGKLPEDRKTRVISTNKDSKEEIDLEGEIKIYPNPVTSNENEITISAPKTQLTILSYTLRNNYGAILLQKYFPDSNTIDISNLNNGMYYIKIQTLQQVVTKQLIKN
jgi:hypothetical protein